MSLPGDAYYRNVVRFGTAALVLFMAWWCSMSPLKSTLQDAEATLGLALRHPSNRIDGTPSAPAHAITAEYECEAGPSIGTLDVYFYSNGRVLFRGFRRSNVTVNATGSVISNANGQLITIKYDEPGPFGDRMVAVVTGEGMNIGDMPCVAVPPQAP